MNGSDLANLETLKNNLENYHLAHSDEIILKGSIDNIINYCDNSIGKEKIREKIKSLEEKIHIVIPNEYNKIEVMNEFKNEGAVDVLKELLEEN